MSLNRRTIYPAEAEGIARVLSAVYIRADAREELWEAYDAILKEKE
jgi:hypothetical protein